MGSTADNQLKAEIFNSKPSEPRNSNFGFYAAMSFGTLALGVSAIALPFVTPAFRKFKLPYLPATQKQIENVFKCINYIVSKDLVLANQNKPLRLIDLGSGDGRIVFEAANRGFKATGVEINTMLYLYSLFKSFSSRSEFKPKFKRANLWKTSLSDYDIIVVFGVQEMMKDLAIKMNNELKPTAKIISCRFPIETYKHIYTYEDEIDSVWIYDKNSLKNPIEINEKK